MTLQEAEQQVDICEREIERTYNSLKNVARDVGTAGFSATMSEHGQLIEEAHRGKKKAIRFPLLITLLGVFLLFTGNFCLGAFIMFCGGVWAIFSAGGALQDESESIQKADAMLKAVDNRLTDLNDFLND